jgi:hypothetical protein
VGTDLLVGEPADLISEGFDVLRQGEIHGLPPEGRLGKKGEIERANRQFLDHANTIPILRTFALGIPLAAHGRLKSVIGVATLTRVWCYGIAVMQFGGNHADEAACSGL